MRRRRIMRSTRKAKDLVWITTIVEASLLEATPTDIGQIVLSGDWSGGNAGFDRCTLMAVRGWVSIAQEAASTPSEATGLFLALYVTDGQVPANSMDPATATEYSIFDVLYTDGLALTATTGTNPVGADSRQLDIRSRRKLSTAQDVRLAASMPADTAGVPRANVIGCFRALLRLDPPS